MVFSYWTISLTSITKIQNYKHEKSPRNNSALTKKPGKVLFYWNALSVVLQYGILRDANIHWILLLPSAQRAQRGIWQEKSPWTEEGDYWRQNERQTHRQLRGRGELGWKDSGEESEINLDTPDGLMLVRVCVCVRACLLRPADPFRPSYRYMWGVLLQTNKNIWYVHNEQRSDLIFDGRRQS